jgi:hypothetical protein
LLELYGTKARTIDRALVHIKFSCRNALRGFLFLDGESATPPIHLDISGTTGTAPLPTESQTSDIPFVSMNDPPFADPLSGPSLGFDLGDFSSPSFIQPTLWSEHSMDRVSAPNVLSPTLSGASGWEATLLQDWSHQDFASEYVWKTVYLLFSSHEP